MQISFSFHEKPKVSSKRQALKLISDIPHIEKDGVFIIETDNLGPQLKKLIKLGYRWKTSKLSIDGKEINLEKIRNVKNCGYSRWCKGCCVKYETIDQYFFRIQRVLQGFYYEWEIDTLKKNCPYIKIEDNTCFFDREKFFQFFSEMSNILQLCDTYNADFTFKKYSEIPDHFSINPHSNNNTKTGLNDGVNSVPIPKFATSEFNIDYSILNSIIFTCNSKVYTQNINFKIKILSFEKISLSEIDNIEEIIEKDKEFEVNGILYLLYCEIMNLSKEEIEFHDIKECLVLVDEDDFIFKFNNSIKFCRSKFSQNKGFYELHIYKFRPKIKKSVVMPIFLPDEENQKYYLGIREGEIKEI